MTTPRSDPASNDRPTATAMPRRLLATVLVLAGPVLAGAIAVVTRGHTPDPLPTHWDTGGNVDGTSDRAGFVISFLIVSAVVALVAAVMCWRARPHAWLLTGAVAFVAWIFAAALATSLLLAVGARTAASVTMPWYSLVLSILVPLLVGVAVWRLHPPIEHEHRLPASSMQLGPGERVVWVGAAHSRPLASIGVVGLLVAAVCAFFVPLVGVVGGVVVGVVALLLLATSSLSVRVDSRGLHTLWGPFGWPRMRMPLDEIVNAHAEDIAPMKWGGWGYRISRRGTASVVRGGPGIVVERDGKADYAVTVDGADRGADVLNALLARGRRARA